jgi:small multidrug resistance pump
LQYIYLAIAIIAEVVATSFLKQSDGFRNAGPSVIMATGYILAFYFLSLALRDIPTGVAYAIWSGVGIVLIAAIAWVFQGQRLDTPAIVGMTMIVGGVVVMQIFSKTTVH